MARPHHTARYNGLFGERTRLVADTPVAGVTGVGAAAMGDIANGYSTVREFVGWAPERHGESFAELLTDIRDKHAEFGVRSLPNMRQRALWTAGLVRYAALRAAARLGDPFVEDYLPRAVRGRIVPVHVDDPIHRAAERAFVLYGANVARLFERADQVMTTDPEMVREAGYHQDDIAAAAANGARFSTMAGLRRYISEKAAERIAPALLADPALAEVFSDVQLQEFATDVTAFVPSDAILAARREFDS